MTISTNAAGVACCGNCGSELEIRCTGNCAEPDIVPRENYVATMRQPARRERKGPRIQWKHVPGVCSYRNCIDPIAPQTGRGRPSNKCVKHLEYSRRWHRKKAAV